jgi:Tfp pilus assembly protein PilF
MPRQGELLLSFWHVELKNPNGIPVRRKLTAVGDTVKFKDLDPGIYVLCVSGTQGRKSCESMDLTVSDSGKSHTFSKEVQPPRFVPNQQDMHQVSAWKLSLPDDAREQMILSERAQLRGDPEEARRHLERAIAICPDYPDALNNLGTYFHRAGDYQTALGYFNRAIDIDPGLYAGWVNMSGSLTGLGRFKEALEAVNNALELRPKDLPGTSQAALVHFYMRDYPTATRYFKKVLELDPASASTPQLFLAHMALGQRKLDEAEAYLRNYLQLHPNSPRAEEVRSTLQNVVSRSIIHSSGPQQARR